MSFIPSRQNKLIGFEKEFDELISLYKENNFPGKLLFKGKKGIGKCTMAYHLINYIFSLNENQSYDLKNNTINENNYSYKLISKNTHPNFFLIELKENKTSIDISQIREMISFSNKTAMNNNNKFVLIDNAECLNLNSINAILKILEEPNEKLCFILIHDSKRKIYETIKSRCLVYNMSLTNENKNNIISLLIDADIHKNNLINYYSTPGEIIHLYQFCINNKIDFNYIDTKTILKEINNIRFLKSTNYIKDDILYFIEIYIYKNILNSNFNLKNYEMYNFFLKKIKFFKKYNLDIESLLIEFNSTFVNE